MRVLVCLWSVLAAAIASNLTAPAVAAPFQGGSDLH